MEKLKQCLFDFILHLFDENILVKTDISSLKNKSFYESVCWLKNQFKEQYPNTKLRPIMKSIHYANIFENKELKESAYLLEEIMEYLSKNKFLNRDECVELFNKKITTEGFVRTPESLLIMDIESLMAAKRL